ncbi:MAG TPA: hypothetical protein VIW74_05590, partial [Pyrinomonadaceae bacterium]
RPNRGHSPQSFSKADGKALPCLTSGGEAAACMTSDFLCKTGSAVPLGNVRNRNGPVKINLE